ncbi:MAG TPA: proton-conducting transporter membrane subunit, partial [Rhodocyclaceae bacterium]
MSEWLMHPGLWLIAAAFVLPLLSGHARAVLILAAPLVSLGLTWQLGDGVHWQLSWLGLELQPLVADKLTRLFATIFALMAFGGGLFALGQKSRIEVPAAFVYAGSAIGVAFAGDLVTVFIFWELMAVGSTLVLWSAATEGAFRASKRYLAIHLFGGVVLFAGITGHIVATGSTAFGVMQADSAANVLILIGFLINAGAPMISAWLPDAYPEASWSGTVFLSAFTTKTAVYVLLRGFPGTEILIWLGIFMIFYGIVYALL